MKELNQAVEELLKKISLNRKIKVKVKPMKRKIASVSHLKGIVYINSRCLEVLNREELLFVIAHELLHLKHGRFHTLAFEEELKSLFGKDLTKEINKKLSAKIIS